MRAMMLATSAYTWTELTRTVPETPMDQSADSQAKTDALDYVRAHPATPAELKTPMPRRTL